MGAMALSLLLSLSAGAGGISAGEARPGQLRTLSAQPTGTIAFVRGDRIWLMNGDGSQQRRITPLKMKASSPALSPDGTRIAFVRRWDSGTAALPADIYLINANGRGLRRLTATKAATEASPSWSPDGRRIAYSSSPSPSTGLLKADLWVMNVTGRSKRRLTRTVMPEDVPCWSPDGTRIAYARYSGIWVMGANGRQQHPITHPSTGFDWAPAWSPDGTRIAFESTRGGPDTGPDELWLMRSNGSYQHRLTSKPRRAGHPSWSPDGRWLAVASARPPNNVVIQIWIVHPNGAGLHRASAGAAEEISPSWSR